MDKAKIHKMGSSIALQVRCS